MTASPIIEKSHRSVHLVDAIGLSVLSDSKAAVWAEEEQMKINLFASKLGVFAAGSLSIDHRLRKNKAVARAIIQILDALLANLRTLRDAYDKTDPPSGQTGGLSSFPYSRSGDEIQAEAQASSDLDGDVDEEVEACSEDEISISKSFETFRGGQSVSKTSRIPFLKDCITENINDLLRYAALIRQYSGRKSGKRSDLYSPPSSDDSSGDDDNEHGGKAPLSLSAKFGDHIEYVLMRELGPDRVGDPDLVYLKDRMRGSMMRRWRRTCYRRAHAEKLETRSETIREDWPVVPDLSESEALLNLTKAAQYSSIYAGTIEGQAKAEVARSVISAATTLESTFSLSKPPETKTNTAKSASRAGGTNLSIPSVPRCEKVGTDYVYDCQYCGRLPMARKPLDRLSWKAHLWADLVPYICLHEHCPSPETEFPTFHAWLEHSRAEHWQSLWICSQCQGPEAEHTTPQSLLLHLKQSHEQRTDEADLSSIAKYSRRDFSYPQCMICGSDQGIIGPETDQPLPIYSEERQHNLHMCMANHLEALSLSSLPWHIGVKNDASSSKAQGSDIQAIQFDDASEVAPLSKSAVSRTANAADMDTIALNAAKEDALALSNVISMWNKGVDDEEDHGGEGTLGSAETPGLAASRNTSPLTPQESISAVAVSKVRALYDFTPSEPGELAFKKNDVIEILEAVYEQWWKGVLRGQTGIIPVNYVEKLQDSTKEEVERDAQMDVEVTGEIISCSPTISDPQQSRDWADEMSSSVTGLDEQAVVETSKEAKAFLVDDLGHVVDPYKAGMELRRPSAPLPQPCLGNEVTSPTPIRIQSDVAPWKVGLTNTWANTMNFLIRQLQTDDLDSPTQIASNQLPPAIPQPGTPLFGVSLGELYLRDRSPVPMFVAQCILAVDLFGIDVQGIYNLGANQRKVHWLEQQFDQQVKQIDFRNPAVFMHDIHSVTMLLKRFFRKLPEPLITWAGYRNFINSAQLEDDEQRRDALHQHINELPDPNYATIRALALHLHRVMQHESKNSMGANNLARCLAPSFMGTDSIGDIGLQIIAVETILRNALAIFDED